MDKDFTMKTKLEQITYTSTFENGDELVVRAYTSNGSLMQTPSIWEKLPDTHLVECKATRRNENGIVECKEYEMTVKQYLSFIDKFHENGVEYFNFI